MGGWFDAPDLHRLPYILLVSLYENIIQFQDYSKVQKAALK